MKNVSINILLFSMLVAGLSSCLKKAPINADPSGGLTNVVEFANTGDNVSTATSLYPRFATDMGVVTLGGTYKFNISVNYSGANSAPDDITVNLALDTAALTLFNTQNGSSYTAPPSTVISFPATLVIKKGTQMAQGQATVTVNNDYSFAVNYGLPLKISSASQGTISGNFGKAVYSFSARNKYDGIYTMEAIAPMSDIVAPTLTGNYPLKVQLRTYTDKSVALFEEDIIDTYGHPIKNGTSDSYYGSFSPVFFFDESGNITSTTNYYGQESGGNKRSCSLNTGANKITFNTDGSVKSIEVNYIMTQSVSSPNAPRTYFYEKFTYVGPR